MKKIIIFILVIIVLVVVLTGVAMLKPNIKRTCKLNKYDISLKIPYAYEEVDTESENTLLNLYNDTKGITISCIDLKDDFWSSGDTMARVDEYVKVMSSANYDSTMRNIETKLISELENKVGRIEFELEKPDSNSKVISLVTNEEIGNVVIEFFGSIESVEENNEEIEKIINSLNIN